MELWKYWSLYLVNPTVCDNEIGGLLQMRWRECGVTTGKKKDEAR